MIKFTKIIPNFVYYHAPYFIECYKCGAVLADDSAEKLAERANQKGWKYNHEKWIFICPNCYRKLKEEEK